MFKFIFGPVPSRRLGMSLGVDLVPQKVCSLDCVYCEVGTTTKLTTERMEYVPYDKVVSELTEYLTNNPAPDYITFSGFGEPLLNSRIGDVLKFIKVNYPQLKVAILTNGTLLSDKNVRAEIMQADVILPSIDAATDKIYKKLNRPEKHLKVEKHIKGLIDFRKEFEGEIWLEVFILPDYNDNNTEICELKKTIHEIQPTMVQLNTLDRPGAIEGLHPATKEQMEDIKSKIDFENTIIVASTHAKTATKTYRDDKESAILETISRRPCTVNDLRDIIGLHINEINKYLDVLEAEKKVTTEFGERGMFYRLINE
jgi:wyosine [tRNA(Phe)-imidazoG37] synthetase (radical SAM superfamily)